MRFFCNSLILLSLSPAFSWADTDAAGQEKDLLCPLINPLLNDYRPPATFAIDQQQETRISAKYVENISGNISQFTGDVQVDRHQFRLKAEHINFQHDTEHMELKQNIHIDASNMTVDADTGWFNLKNNSGQFNNAQYQIIQPYFQGSSPALEFENRNVSRLNSSIFSSCPPGNRD